MNLHGLILSQESNIHQSQRIWMRILAPLCFTMLTWSCQPDKPPVPKEYPEPTPYTWTTRPFFPPPILPSDNPLTLQGVELGRHLFYEKKMSGDNSQSCASCHRLNYAFSDSLQRYSTGIDGIAGTRNSMALFNLTWHTRFFWDGRAPGLRQQVLMPIQDPIEMHQTLPETVRKISETTKYKALFGSAFRSEEVTPDRIARALEQFLLTVVSGDSRFDRFRQNPVANPLSASEQRGFDLFMREYSAPSTGRPRGADCFHCHGGHLFRVDAFFDNGLDEQPATGYESVTGSASDRGKFKASSLRNITLTAPYMHDGRFSTLEEVLEHYSHHLKNSPNLDPNLRVANQSEGGLNLSSQDKQDIIAFLHTLTDSSFISNPAYKMPLD
ncbi:MAG: cytochrome-c peroxidase [Sphingomonadales bacterium]|nr:cytochrome-c peroxidase [Sphingomonadales bacterium]